MSHLSLHILDLLLEEVISLLFIDIFTRLVADVGLESLEVDLTIDQFHHSEEALFYSLL